MKRQRLAVAMMLLAPLAFAPVACGGGDDRSALENDELDRELDLALEGDTVAPTFQDTAVGDAEQPQAETPRQQAPAPTPQRQQPRQEQPRAQQPTQPRTRTVSLSVPTGTTFAIHMNETLSTERNKAGDSFTARLADPIVDANGMVIVPAGAVVRGRVTAVSPSTRAGQTAALKLAFEAISFGGESYPLQATVQSADVEQQTRTGVAESAGKVAVGAAAGAILGQVIGKDKESTLKGAAIGAAAGTAIAMGTTDVDAVLPEGAEVVIRTDQPITVTRTVTS